MNQERGRIFYAEPKHKRQVKVVDWCDTRGIVRSSDHYNRYGALYARTTFNARGQKVNKTYFSVTGQEAIVENFVTGDIILNDGEEVKIFHTRTDFVLYFMEKAGYEKSRIFYNSLSYPFFVSQRLSQEKKEDILFWQEPVRDEIPGNMKVILEGNSTRTSQIMVQKREAYDKMLALGAPESMLRLLGFIHPFQKENHGKPEVLICTNSDRIEQCQKLVAALPELHFHITALTEMSSKLMSMGTYENVSLYPGVKMHILNELFESCDYYFDINHEGEIVSAVQSAFLHNQLIFAFQETMHNGVYVASEHVYRASEVEQMVSDVKAVLTNQTLRKEHLDMQREWALTERKEAYLDI